MKKQQQHRNREELASHMHMHTRIEQSIECAQTTPFLLPQLTSFPPPPPPPTLPSFLGLPWRFDLPRQAQKSKRAPEAHTAAAGRGKHTTCLVCVLFVCLSRAVSGWRGECSWARLMLVHASIGRLKLRGTRFSGSGQVGMEPVHKRTQAGRRGREARRIGGYLEDGRNEFK
ncbi:uncharacterized protein LY79DRAFT_568868 [Colletotrichum navitas]|uniref:Uncharacterized protein n=1 Tax=Colletotrichum navitas TaxID=681940 RepID=A0AAD8PP04_9PEZI|nr:uncharacterized protein LY79DRAFT_568868 [Colletotrichum navitas]KAK1573333.1 hypothetical protein LY79DRAFT_568868 [Colletotrichum navitas]